VTGAWLVTAFIGLVGRGGVEPPTFRFQGHGGSSEGFRRRSARLLEPFVGHQRSDANVGE